MLQVATTEPQVGSWDGIVAAAAALGVPDAVISALGRRRASSLQFPALPRRRAVPAECDCTSGSARARPPCELLERGVRMHERTEVTRIGRDGSVETRAGRVRAGAAVLAVNSAAAVVPRLPAFARRRIEPHRPHRADPGRARRARLDGRRGDRRQPHARPLHRERPRRPDRLRLGRWRDGARRARRPIGSSSIATSSPRRSGLSSASSRRRAVERHARLGRPDRRLPHAPADLREPRTHSPRLRLHRKRRRAVLPRRRDPRAPRARPPRRENRARDRRAPAEALPPEPFRYVGRLAHPPRARWRRTPRRTRAASRPLRRGSSRRSPAGSDSAYRAEQEGDEDPLELVYTRDVSNVRHWGLRYRAHNGVPRWAVVVAPAQYGPRHPPPPLPLVISPHGRGVRARTNARLWRDLPARGGFAVDLSGRDGKAPAAALLGLAGSDRRSRAHAGDPSRRTAVAADRSERIYAVGGSMGGQETLLLVGQHPRLLAGAVAFDSVTDFFRRYGDFALLGRKGVALQALARLEVGGTPSTNPEAYRLRSPQHWLERDRRFGSPAADLVERRRRDRHRPGEPVGEVLRTTCRRSSREDVSRRSRAPGATPPRATGACSCREPSAGSAWSQTCELRRRSRS